MGLETAVSQRGKKNLLVRHVVKYHWDPLEMFKLWWRKKWIILIQVGVEGGEGGGEGEEIFPSEDLKINSTPLPPPSFILGDHMQACSSSLFKFQLYICGRLLNSE